MLVLRGKIVAPKQGAAVYREDDRLPALDMENLPEPAPQPMADADKDAPREDALPLGDDDVQPVQGSRSSSSSSSSSSCSDDIEEPANQHPKYTASRMNSEQRTRHLVQYECVAHLAVWARLGDSVRTKSEHQGEELKRAISVSSQREWLHNNSFM